MSKVTIVERELLKLDDQDCTVCKAGFRKTDLDEQGRCFVCAGKGLDPGTKEKFDQVKQAKIDYNQVKKMVQQALAEIKAEEKAVVAVPLTADQEAKGFREEKPAPYAPKKCKVCEKEFLPSAPAQKTCESCSEKKTE
jgi:hypothetical protein